MKAPIGALSRSAGPVVGRWCRWSRPRSTDMMAPTSEACPADRGCNPSIGSPIAARAVGLSACCSVAHGQGLRGGAPPSDSERVSRLATHDVACALLALMIEPRATMKPTAMSRTP
jgi:hypothetical protein